MIVCDLCGQSKECLQKEIDGKEYDICSECWNPLEAKLKGKGRMKKERETVFLPAPNRQPEPEEPKPEAGKPPTIWGEATRRRGRHLLRSRIDRKMEPSQTANHWVFEKAAAPDHRGGP
jgi:hypothetical protein